MIGPISPDVKQMGARSAGNPHAACDVEGAGNVARSGCLGRLARQSSTLPPANGCTGGGPSTTRARSSTCWVQRRRDTRAALRLMRKLLRKQGFVPKLLVTDKLRSY